MTKSIYVLGVYTGHNATAALLRDGKIIACVSEERFTGIKNQYGLPAQSIAWCLKFANITTQDLELIAIPSTFGSPMFLSEGTKNAPTVRFLQVIYDGIVSVRSIWGKLVYYYPKIRLVGTFLHLTATKTYGIYLLNKEKRFLASYLRVSIDKIVTTGHHLSHAAAAYYCSPYNDQKALVLTLDAEGDDVCSTVSMFHKYKIKRLASSSRENSLGWMYHDLTIFLGMKPGEHEYKVMGLAPYAKEKDVQKVYEKIKNIITIDPKNNLRFLAKFNTQDTLYYLRKEMTGVRFDIVAGAFQKLLEIRIVEWVQAAVTKTKIHTVVFSGGVAMNVKTNMLIRQTRNVSRTFFMPSAGDESLAIGSCYLAYTQLSRLRSNYPYPQPLKNLYLGPSFTSTEIKDFLSKHAHSREYTITEPKNMERKIAQLLSKGNVVARLSGRMEWGARALGNRSILANPQNQDVVKIINDQMKQRDFWMPFAPSILADQANKYCINLKNADAPYMMVCFDSTPLARKELRAALHPYDFTLRPQFVTESWNPSYYRIIKEFKSITGIGGVLNTSFNLHGLPIVLGPKEAMYAFEHSGLQYLALGPCLITKNS